MIPPMWQTLAIVVVVCNYCNKQPMREGLLNVNLRDDMGVLYRYVVVLNV